MKKLGMFVMVVMMVVGMSGNVRAEKGGTAAEAESMVKKAIAYAKANGNEAAFAEISNPKGKFVDRDLYVTVYDMSGKCLAHGANNKMIGKDLLGLTDPDGKAIFKERIDVAKAQGKGWQDYKFTNPLTKKIEPKRAYFEKYGDIVFACGFYKD